MFVIPIPARLLIIVPYVILGILMDLSHMPKFEPFAKKSTAVPHTDNQVVSDDRHRYSVCWVFPCSPRSDVSRTIVAQCAASSPARCLNGAICFTSSSISMASI